MLLAGLRPASPVPAVFIQGDDPLEPPGRATPGGGPGYGFGGALGVL
jgi:hypothetical protein